MGRENATAFHPAEMPLQVELTEFLIQIILKMFDFIFYLHVVEKTVFKKSIYTCVVKKTCTKCLISHTVRTAWVQKIKAASESFIETEKKKREKSFQCKLFLFFFSFF